MRDDPLIAIRGLLIDDQGVPEADVKPEARLLHDLGVDGDDAAEMFQKLREEFGTDFAELDRQWRAFFNTEGSSPRAMLIGIPAVILCAGLGGALAGAFHWPRFIAIFAALVLFIGGSWSVARLFGRPLRPVTVGGLAEIIQSGRWPADPDNVR